MSGFLFIFSIKISGLVVFVSFEVDDVFERNGSFCQTKPHRGRILVLCAQQHVVAFGDREVSPSSREAIGIRRTAVRLGLFCYGYAEICANRAFAEIDLNPAVAGWRPLLGCGRRGTLMPNAYLPGGCLMAIGRYFLQGAYPE